jgi:hypothetical protein
VPSGDQNPGPGSYHISNSATELRSPQHDFSKSPERPDRASRNESNLGPGTYDAKDGFFSGSQIASSIAYSIPKGERDQQASETPGPGYYYLPVKFGD